MAKTPSINPLHRARVSGLGFRVLQDSISPVTSISSFEKYSASGCFVPIKPDNAQPVLFILVLWMGKASEKDTSSHFSDIFQGNVELMLPMQLLKRPSAKNYW